jgi:hypothetical protein
MLTLARTKARPQAREGKSALARFFSALTQAPLSRTTSAATWLTCRSPPALSTSPGAISRCSGSTIWPQALADLGRGAPRGRARELLDFGPDTLRELRSAFAGIDRYSHVNRFIDMHDIGDMLVAAGFGDPVMHMEYVTLTYADAKAMLRELKAIGATNATRLRPKR